MIHFKQFNDNFEEENNRINFNNLKTIEYYTKFDINYRKTRLNMFNHKNLCKFFCVIKLYRKKCI